MIGASVPSLKAIGALAGAAIAGVIGLGIDMMEDHQASKNGGSKSGAGGTAAGGATPPDDDEKDKSARSPKSQTQTESKKLYETKGIRPGEKGYARIDVENPNPGQRPGQVHLQMGGRGSTHHVYDPASGTFRALSARQNNELLSRPEVQRAIAKGLSYLGM